MSKNELRLVVLGSAGVGKTAVTLRFVSGVFVERYDPTIEDSYRKTASIDGKEVMLEILDTAGTDQFTALRDLYMKLGNAFLFVYSVTSKNSMAELDTIYESLMRNREDEPPILLLANKTDMPSERHMVSKEDGQALSKKFNNCSFMEISALSSHNIESAFNIAAKMAQEKVRDQDAKSKPRHGFSLCTVL